MKSNVCIDDCICNPTIAGRIFYHLPKRSFLECAAVSKIWYWAVRQADIKRTLIISTDTAKQLKTKKAIRLHLKENYQNAVDVEIFSWSKNVYVGNEVYDNLFTPKLSAKRLIIHGRGTWDTCYCSTKASNQGDQSDPLATKRLTNLEYIHITSPFNISSCALLDLISRSPKLKVLRFYGRILNGEHSLNFTSKRFYCDIENVYWPWPSKSHLQVMNVIIKRNENITTLFSTAETVCDFLAADILPNMRNLSLMLTEDWNIKPVKRIYDYLKKIQYISLAKKLEALEIRAFSISLDEEDQNFKLTVERIYEDYILKFWSKVAELPNLKYLAVFGSWDMEKVCRELAKHAIQVEYLKINLLPSATMLAVDDGEDRPILSMADGVRNLRKLPKLRSLHYICYEKLGSIDDKTANALKESLDLVWILDIKTPFTSEVNDILNSILRRGNQLGKVYRINLHVRSKDPIYADFVTKVNMKTSTNLDLSRKLGELAEIEAAERYPKGAYESVHIWGIEQVDNLRDREIFQDLKSNWTRYNKVFQPSFMFI